MKVRTEGNRILAFGKRIAVAEASAETIGIERLTRDAGDQVFSAMDAAIARGVRDRYYEDFYSDLVERGALSALAVEVGDLAWSEVDTFEDLARARQCV